MELVRRGHDAVDGIGAAQGIVAQGRDLQQSWMTAAEQGMQQARARNLANKNRIILREQLRPINRFFYLQRNGKGVHVLLRKSKIILNCGLK